jgi:hypothetical protein
MGLAYATGADHTSQGTPYHTSNRTHTCCPAAQRTVSSPAAHNGTGVPHCPALSSSSTSPPALLQLSIHRADWMQPTHAVSSHRRQMCVCIHGRAWNTAPAAEGNTLTHTPTQPALLLAHPPTTPWQHCPRATRCCCLLTIQHIQQGHTTHTLSAAPPMGSCTAAVPARGLQEGATSPLLALKSELPPPPLVNDTHTA